MERITQVVAWAEQSAWTKDQQGRLKYLQAIVAQDAQFSRGVQEGPDDTSPFGQPVYLMDMNVVEMKEYLLSGLSKKEQSRIFSS